MGETVQKKKATPSWAPRWPGIKFKTLSGYFLSWKEENTNISLTIVKGFCVFCNGSILTV